MTVSGVALAATGVGLAFLYSGLKGASIGETLKSVIKGEAPKGTQINPITVQTVQAAGNAAIAAVGSGLTSAILTAAASHKGQRYCFGGGHVGDPRNAACTDCSGYVSAVLNEIGVFKNGESMATGGLSKIGTQVTYDQRQPGDLIVWNGGTGGGHVGIIIDGGTMWNNPCTACGGVQISHYPFGSRSAAAAVIRRVTH